MQDARSGNLFGTVLPVASIEISEDAPLAERMRPGCPEELVGQRHLLGEGRLLRRLLDQGELASLILWGPPGAGKTTIARLLARSSSARLIEISATSSGVRQLREAAQTAADLRRASGQRTILFIDEIHRFHKGQQDALLPWVERGQLLLIGATTENPSFEVIAPLLSRCRVVRLEPLGKQDLHQLLVRTLETPPPRGLHGPRFRVQDKLVGQLAAAADGDARTALNSLELASQIALAGADTDVAVVEIEGSAVLEAIQQQVLRYGREERFNQVSALQKSVRSSDPDAALYWLARMLEAGEDPKYVARRLIRMASEDVGLADPRALATAVAGLHAVEAIGLPEGALALAEVAIYLAVAPKSDAVYRAYAGAVREIESSGNLPVPLRLRNAVTSLMREEGYGRGYQHAHDADDAVVGMECLPDALSGHRFYAPTDRGVEARIRERLRELKRLKRKSEFPDPANERPSG